VRHRSESHRGGRSRGRVDGASFSTLGRLSGWPRLILKTSHSTTAVPLLFLPAGSTDGASFAFLARRIPAGSGLVSGNSRCAGPSLASTPNGYAGDQQGGPVQQNDQRDKHQDRESHIPQGGAVAGATHHDGRKHAKTARGSYQDERGQHGYAGVRLVPWKRGHWPEWRRAVPGWQGPKSEDAASGEVRASEVGQAG
jgi:hypothetical protein